MMNIPCFYIILYSSIQLSQSYIPSILCTFMENISGWANCHILDLITLPMHSSIYIIIFIYQIEIRMRPDNNNSYTADPEFLTFRHNSPQPLLTSGRSIYSQRFDYKSAQKCAIFDSCNSQREDLRDRTHKNILPTRKENFLRNVRSQDKYKEALADHVFNAEDSDLQHDDSVARRDWVDSNRPKEESNRQRDRKKVEGKMGVQSELERNLDLKARLTKLIKSMKKEQKKELGFEREIEQLECCIKDYDREIQEQINNISELNQIGEENMKQCDRIIESIHKLSSHNEEMATNLDYLEHSVTSPDTSVDTTRQDEAKDRAMCSKLKEGMSELTRMKNSAEVRVRRLEEQIEEMETQLERMKLQEMEVARMLGFDEIRQSSSNYSHHSQNQSHQSQNQSHNSHSQHSSSGSNRESLFYY